ncbi:MAG: hypothetical protein AB1938_02840 [Myxococcota bacterium]
MILVLALLAATPNVIDETNSLNASQRAELWVASEGRVVVALIDTGRQPELEARAEALSRTNPGLAVVVYDVTLDQGTIRPASPIVDVHERIVFDAEVDRLSRGPESRQARLLRAIDFASRNVLFESPEARAPVPEWTLSRAWDELLGVLKFLVLGLFFLVVLVSKVAFAPRWSRSDASLWSSWRHLVRLIDWLNSSTGESASGSTDGKPRQGDGRR